MINIRLETKQGVKGKESGVGRSEKGSNKEKSNDVSSKRKADDGSRKSNFAKILKSIKTSSESKKRREIIGSKGKALEKGVKKKTKEDRTSFRDNSKKHPVVKTIFNFEKNDSLKRKNKSEHINVRTKQTLKRLEKFIREPTDISKQKKSGKIKESKTKELVKLKKVKIHLTSPPGQKVDPEKIKESHQREIGQTVFVGFTNTLIEAFEKKNNVTLRIGDIQVKAENFNQFKFEDPFRLTLMLKDNNETIRITLEQISERSISVTSNQINNKEIKDKILSTIREFREEGRGRTIEIEVDLESDENEQEKDESYNKHKQQSRYFSNEGGEEDGHDSKH